jgi:hypothetical protein
MNDTTRRFLTAIVERVPAGGEIAELRLFPAIRQGGIESGVAVVAVQLPGTDPAPATEARPDSRPEAPRGEGTGEVIGEVTGELTTEAIGEGSDEMIGARAETRVDAAEAVPVGKRAASPGAVEIPPAVHDLVDTDVAVEDEEGGDGDEHPVPLSFVPMADTTGEFEVADALDAEVTEIVVAVEREVVPAGVASAISAGTANAVADGPPPADEPAIPLADILALPSPLDSQHATTGDALRVGSEGVVDRASEPSPRRYAILTARYRLAIKGPDRGKWDVEITHEADAPLETVERVARGVARRAGEASDPEHYSGESLRAALEAPVWATTP